MEKEDYFKIESTAYLNKNKKFGSISCQKYFRIEKDSEWLWNKNEKIIFHFKNSLKCIKLLKETIRTFPEIGVIGEFAKGIDFKYKFSYVIRISIISNLKGGKIEIRKYKTSIGKDERKSNGLILSIQEVKSLLKSVKIARKKLELIARKAKIKL